MTFSRDTVAVGVIVLTAMAWAVRSVWRAVRQRRICSTCAASDDCPLTKSREPQELEEIQR